MQLQGRFTAATGLCTGVGIPRRLLVVGPGREHPSHTLQDSRLLSTYLGSVGQDHVGWQHQDADHGAGDSDNARKFERGTGFVRRASVQVPPASRCQVRVSSRSTPSRTQSSELAGTRGGGGPTSELFLHQPQHTRPVLHLRVTAGVKGKPCQSHGRYMCTRQRQGESLRASERVRKSEKSRRE